MFPTSIAETEAQTAGSDNNSESSLVADLLCFLNGASDSNSATGSRETSLDTTVQLPDSSLAGIQPYETPEGYGPAWTIVTSKQDGMLGANSILQSTMGPPESGRSLPFSQLSTKPSHQSLTVHYTTPGIYTGRPPTYTVISSCEAGETYQTPEQEGTTNGCGIWVELELQRDHLATATNGTKAMDGAFSVDILSSTSGPNGNEHSKLSVSNFRYADSLVKLCNDESSTIRLKLLEGVESGNKKEALNHIHGPGKWSFQVRRARDEFQKQFENRDEIMKEYISTLIYKCVDECQRKGKVLLASEE